MEAFSSSDTPSASCSGILRRNPITHLFSATSSSQGKEKDEGKVAARENLSSRKSVLRRNCRISCRMILSEQFEEMNCSFLFLRGVLDLIAFTALNPSTRFMGHNVEHRHCVHCNYVAGLFQPCRTIFLRDAVNITRRTLNWMIELLLASLFIFTSLCCHVTYWIICLFNQVHWTLKNLLNSRSATIIFSLSIDSAPIKIT